MYGNDISMTDTGKKKKVGGEMGGGLKKVRRVLAFIQLTF